MTGQTGRGSIGSQELSSWLNGRFSSEEGKPKEGAPPCSSSQLTYDDARKRRADSAEYRRRLRRSALRASMGASHGKVRSPSPSPPPFALKRRCSSGAAQAELLAKGGGCCVFHGHGGKRGSAVRVKGPLLSSSDASSGGVFDPSRSHPNVTLLLSDLKGREHHFVHRVTSRRVASSALSLLGVSFSFSRFPAREILSHAQLCIFL